MKHLINKIFLTLFLFSACISSANAVLINYDFSATYHDGSNAAGDFNYDTETTLFSDILIELTGGSSWGDQLFTVNHYVSNRALVLLDVADGPDYNKDTVFHIILQDGGKWGDLAPSKVYSDIAECDKSHCPARRNLDVAPVTSMVGTVVNIPEPTPFALLGLALIGLSFRKKTK